ncbi:PD40 domain-containing protein [bacterium]|nr:PD40 domain-containing protein [bacterium]
MIKKPSILFYFILLSYFFGSTSFAMNLQVGSTKHAKVPFAICLLGPNHKSLNKTVQVIQDDLSFTHQFSITLDYINALNNQGDIKSFFTKGFPLVLFLSQKKKGKFIEWRLYDTQQATFIAGKRYKKRTKNYNEWGHHISDQVWPVVTGLPGLFSTKIAYCKELQVPGKKVFKHVYVADYNGKNAKRLVATSTVNVAPRWNRDPENPLLFYSEHTNTNVRLVVVDMFGHRKVVSNFDGMNMLPTFSFDGKKVVFCASNGGSKCQLYYYEKGVFEKLTNNNGNNISPAFSDDEKILFFCSDFETKGPQIYKYNFDTKKTERLTGGGYCVSPSYCGINDTLAYAKMIRGTMQIFLYDFTTKKHKQITCDAGNKEECSWSPCGNYLLFAVETEKESRLALLNLITNNRTFVTKGKVVCCYPAWSCPYSNFVAA